MSGSADRTAGAAMAKPAARANVAASTKAAGGAPALRPTKAQQKLLEYIAGFIKQHGYGPSYREIMRAQGFRSVSTVAVHIDGLVAAGKLLKRGRSARSLEVIGEVVASGVDKSTSVSQADNGAHEDWLLARIEAYSASENADIVTLKAMAGVCAALGLTRAKTLSLKLAEKTD